jgi:hypothetical protein
MRYMMLIYSRETAQDRSADEDARIHAAHRAVMQDATEKGVLIGAEPLAPTTSATTIRMQDGKMLITDGPFAETKEQLAGYYIIDCKDLEEAMAWAARIPTSCYGGEGCVEIRPMRGVSKIDSETASQYAGSRNA